MPKTVQLSDEAYRTLAAIKEPGESFSDAVKRLVAERKNPLELLKLPRPRPDFDFEKFRRRMDAADRRRLRRLRSTRR